MDSTDTATLSLADLAISSSTTPTQGQEDIDYRFPTKTPNKAQFLFDWPPSVLDLLPRAAHSPILSSQLQPITESIFADLDELPNSDFNTKKCPLVTCWSADLVKTVSGTFLQLPQFRRTNVGVSAAKFNYRANANDNYLSNRLLVRDCYIDIANEIVRCCCKERKSWTINAAVNPVGHAWHLEVLFWEVFDLETNSSRRRPPSQPSSRYCILRRSSFAEGLGLLQGIFYKCSNLRTWMASDECDELLDDQDAWLIYDGSIPPELPRCKTLVITSPGNLAKDKPGAKAFHESTPFERYFPTWTFQECVIAGRHLYNCDDVDVAQIKERYILYGGIPRFVLEWFWTM